MAELATKFIERSEGDLESMRMGLARLAKGEAEALGGLRQLAHRMCGTGATLGFGRLGDCAAAIEQLADNCPGGTLPDAAVRARLLAGVEALGAELTRLRRDEL